MGKKKYSNSKNNALNRDFLNDGSRKKHGFNKKQKILRKIKRVSDKFFENEHLVSMIVPVLCGGLYLILCLINITSSIWFDESYSAYLVRGNFAQIWQETSLDVHPPLYYFALKIWSSIFGATDFSMRFMSVFFGIVTIIVLFQLMRKMFGVKIASLATFFVAISPMFIRYGQEMRMYTMLAAILVTSTYFLISALNNYGTDSFRKWAILYAIFVSLGMWTQYFAALVFLAHVVIIFRYFGGVKEFFRKKELKKKWFLIYLLAVILYLPWMPSFIKQVVDVEGGFWIAEISAATPISFLTDALIYKDASGTTSWMAVLVWAQIAIFGISFYKIAKEEELFADDYIVEVPSGINLFTTSDKVLQKKGTKNHVLSNAWYLEVMIIMVAVPVLILLVLSLPPLKSTFVDRYLLVSIICLFALFGIVAGLSKGKKCGILIALTIGTSVLGIVNVSTRNPSGYIKDILAEVYASADEGEPILANTAWTYYDSIFYSTDEHPIYGIDKWMDYEWGSLDPIKSYRVNLVDDADKFFSEHDKVWYIVDTDKKDKDLPEDLSDYEIKTEISLDHHTAYELAKPDAM